MEQRFNNKMKCANMQRCGRKRIGILLIGLLIVFSKNGYTQKLCTLSLDSNERILITSFKKEFNLKIFDTVFVYHTYHTFSNSTACFTHTKNYFIWSDGVSNYFTIQDACFDYTPLKIDNSFFQYYINKKDSLLSETLKNPSYYLDDAGIFWLIASYNGKEFSASFPVAYFHGYFGNDSIAVFNNQSHLKMYHNYIENYMKELSNKIEYTQKKKIKNKFEFPDRGTPAKYEN